MSNTSLLGIGLYAVARGGETLQGGADWYEIEVEAVESAVAFEHSLKAA